MSAGLAPNLKETRCIRIANTDNEQDNANEQDETTAPEQPPRGMAITVGADAKNGERFAIARERVFAHLACGEPEVERSRDNCTATKEDGAKKQEE